MVGLLIWSFDLPTFPAICFLLLKRRANGGVHYLRFATKDFVDFFASRSLPTELGGAEDSVKDEL